MAQYFEQALIAKLQSITALTAIIGNGSGGFFASATPQTWDFGADGPSLTWSIPTKLKGQVLAGGDSTAMPRCQLDVWSYSQAATKQALKAIYDGINGVPVNPWGDGSCVIVAVVHQGDTDANEPPRAGTDQWIYHSFSEYYIQYRLTAAVG